MKLESDIKSMSIGKRGQEIERLRKHIRKSRAMHAAGIMTYSFIIERYQKAPLTPEEWTFLKKFYSSDVFPIFVANNVSNMAARGPAYDAGPLLFYSSPSSSLSKLVAFWSASIMSSICPANIFSKLCQLCLMR